MRVLFITDECYNKSGGGTYTRGLIEAFNNIVGVGNLYVYFPYCHPDKENYNIPGIVIGNVGPGKGGVTENDKILPPNFREDNIYEINEIIRQKSIEYIILWRSTYGGILRQIDKQGAKVITFFYDIQGHGMFEKINTIQVEEFANEITPMVMEYLNECASVKQSDACMVLNSREAHYFSMFYHKEPSGIIPIFCKDVFCKDKLVKCDSRQCNLLFVGGYYWPNLIGIRWFVKNVMPKLDNRFELNIVGRGMLRLKEELENKRANVHVIGRVENLDDWYYNADIVVGPIFNGTGMKTKTVEALMYGKIYLGTAEALCGYEGMEEFLCNTEEDYVDKINDYFMKQDKFKFCEYTRKEFESYYSMDVICRKLQGILERC